MNYEIEQQKKKDLIFKKEIEKPPRNDVFACLIRCERCKYHLDYAYVKKHGWSKLNYCCLLLKFDDFLKYSKSLNDDKFKDIMLDDLDFKPDCYTEMGKSLKF